MADFLLLQTPIGVSKTPESSFNTMKTLQADFFAAVTQQLQVSLPILEKITNAGLVGSQHGYATEHTPDYFSHPSITMSDRLNTSLFAIYLRRMLGGAVNSTAVTATDSYDHTFGVLPATSDPQLASSTFAVKAGGMDLLMGGFVGNSLTLNFQDAQTPTFQAEFIGSGKFEYMADQTPALVMPALVSQNYMGVGAGVECSFNDGTLLNLHSVGRLKSVTFNWSNNTITNDRRAGDPLRTASNYESGAIAGRLTRDVPTLTVQLQVYVDGNKREWAAHLANTTIADFTFLARGKTILATSDRHEVEIVVPQGVFTNPQLTPDRGKHILSLTLEPQLASGENGLWNARIRNGSSTLS